jgi:sugar lactone lactonase YvrE
MMTKLDSNETATSHLRALLYAFVLISAGLLLPTTVGAQVSFTGTAASRGLGSHAIGSQSAAQALSFSVSANSTVGSIAVLTTGAVNLDFTNAPASTCSAQNYSQATQCTVEVRFAPSAVGLRMGAVVFYSEANNSGSALATVPIYGIGIGPQIGFGPGTATAIDPKVNGIFLLEPVAVAFDGAGDLFVAEIYGVIKLPAGGGAATAIYPTVNGEGLDYPSGLAIDGAGNLFIADFEHNRVVEVPAGGGAAIAIDPTVKGRPLDGPYGVAVDALGNLYIADSRNWRVVEVPAGGGAAIDISPIVNGVELQAPQYVAVDGAGDLFIADTLGKRIVELPAGGGAAIVIDPTVNGKSLLYSYGVAVDAAGDLFIADTDHSRVIEVPAGGGAPIAIDPLVNGKALGGPTNVTIDSAGDVFIADTFNNRLVKLQRSQPPALGFPYPTALGSNDLTDGTQTVQILNIGNQPLVLSSINFPADFSQAGEDTNECVGVTTLSAGEECDVLLGFTPSQSGALNETVTLTDNTLNGKEAQQSIVASGIGVVLAVLTSPTPGASLPGTGATFSWTAGTGASGYKLWLGSTGAGSNNLYNSGVKTATSVTMKGLPVNGETVYARLFTNFNGTTEYTDFTYSASSPAVLLSPVPGSTLLGNSVTFTWSPAAGAISYGLWLGTEVNSNNLGTSGATTNTFATLGALPTNGETIYARLTTLYNGAYYVITNFSFTAATFSPATLTSPAPGSKLAGSSAAFSWTAGTGATAYQILIGSTGVGSRNVYSAGNITTTSTSISGLPTNGETFYVRLYTTFNGSSQYSDSTCTAVAQSPATLTSPKPGSTITPNTAFTWTTGQGVASYQLMLGATGVGSSGLYNSGPQAATSATVSGLPSNGAIVYARLLSQIAGVWQSVDYTFTEASTAPVLTSPTSGSTLGTVGVPFTWTTGAGYADYQLWLGTSGPGSSSLFVSGSTTATSVTVPNLPKNGVKIYARLYFGNGGPWNYTDYTFTAQ